MKTKNLIIVCVIFGGLFMSSQATVNKQSEIKSGKFQNSDINYQTSMSNLWKIIKSYISTNRQAPQPNNNVPVTEITTQSLAKETADAIYRLGHSTLLVRLQGKLILIDPVFSERASPVQWAGPKRFHQSPISIEALPNIDAVIISHDHYDHLDEAAIKKLSSKVTRFITPLKVGEYLRSWGVSHEKITELDWWQSTKVSTIEIVATPAQHFSGRGVFDKDETLWASWVIASPAHKLFYSGDSGYFSGFKAIGEKYGPFDFTMIETGAYNDLWSEIHMTPEQSLQTHFDVQGRYMIPVHNGTFDLALHDWFEPFERISELAKNRLVTLLTPMFGDAIIMQQPKPTSYWWRSIMEVNNEMKDSPINTF